MTALNTDMPRVSADVLKAQILSVFKAWGMPDGTAATAAEVMVETDLRGVDSHGINMLQQYRETFRRGALNVKATIRVLRDRPTSALIDADRGLGHPVSVDSMDRAIEKARRHDIGLVCVTNSHHFGAAGYYAERAARAGMIGIVTTSTRGITLVPTRGIEPVLGTNPFAFASPAGRYPPLVLDFATTVAAVNKVKVRHLRDLELPQGWVSDGDGRTVTDPEEALSIFARRTTGGFNPVGGTGETLGGHKGYGLALFSHIMSGALPGASFSPIRVQNQKSDDPDDLGHYFQAINPDAFRPYDDFIADIEDAVAILKNVTPADPGKPVLVAGEPEYLTHIDRSANGVPVNENLRQLIRDVTRDAGVPYLLDKP